MTTETTATPLHKELLELAAPVRDSVLRHRFWTGLREGGLPATALARFVEQDTGHLLPAYARALARCAAAAPEDADAQLFGQSVVGTLEARDGLLAAYRQLVPELDLPLLATATEALPATAAHAFFFGAASATSYAAGVGALLPMVWFNAEVSDHLRDHVTPGSRYAPWIAVYHPGEGYRYAVQAFLDLADRIGETCSARDRQVLKDHFAQGIRYELAFAECCAGG
ncbi:TenA family protein [Streptacidiphilus neutrinimicus]|uniref:TenA family protein n=1 Tax=Streptacidiphilus neutrinimicus TaxID=105420 RepID=UPI0005AA286E|nr:TenA family transcriptional regulator [Streptacidiphilus neutrinimicus]